MCIDVCANDESNDVEEWYPGLLRQELLSKCKRDGRGGPRNLHDGKETGANGGADLVEGASTSDNGHGGQVDGVLNGCNLDMTALARRLGKTVAGQCSTYHQVADKNLENLGLQAGSASEQALQDIDEDVAQGSADKGAIDGHLRNACGEVVAILVPVLCDP